MIEVVLVSQGLAYDRPKRAARPPRRRLPPAGIFFVGSAAVWLAAWWLAAAVEIVPPLFLPSPVVVAARFISVIGNGYADATLIEHAGASLFRVLAALVSAFLVAVPVGIGMGLSPVLRGIFDPVIEAYRPIPPLAYLPLVIIWLGIGETAKVLLIFLAILPPIALATASGVRGVPAERINAALTLGATRLQVLCHIILPNALPEILVGTRIGLSVGWSTLVAAELVAATRGLGFMIETAANFLVTDVVVVGIISIAIIAFALEFGMRTLERRLTPWKGKL
jgi:taurine transport system permease protein